MLIRGHISLLLILSANDVALVEYTAIILRISRSYGKAIYAFLRSLTSSPCISLITLLDRPTIVPQLNKPVS